MRTVWMVAAAVAGVGCADGEATPTGPLDCGERRVLSFSLTLTGAIDDSWEHTSCGGSFASGEGGMVTYHQPFPADGDPLSLALQWSRPAASHADGDGWTATPAFVVDELRQGEFAPIAENGQFWGFAVAGEQLLDPDASYELTGGRLTIDAVDEVAAGPVTTAFIDGELTAGFTGVDGAAGGVDLSVSFSGVAVFVAQ